MYAVITGDLVHSSKLSGTALQAAQQCIESIIKLCAENWKAEGELYRGDGFQLFLPEPAQAIRVAVLLSTRLAAAGVGVTLSVGLGKARLGERIALSQGQAFELSGRGLEATGRGELSFHSAQQHLQECFELATGFLSFLLRKLTQKQAEVLYAWVISNFAEHKYIAEQLNMTRQNVNLHLSKAGGHLVQSFHQQFAALVAENRLPDKSKAPE